MQLPSSLPPDQNPHIYIKSQCVGAQTVSLYINLECLLLGKGVREGEEWKEVRGLKEWDEEEEEWKRRDE